MEYIETSQLNITPDESHWQYSKTPAIDFNGIVYSKQEHSSMAIELAITPNSFSSVNDEKCWVTKTEAAAASTQRKLIVFDGATFCNIVVFWSHNTH